MLKHIAKDAKLAQTAMYFVTINVLTKPTENQVIMLNNVEQVVKKAKRSALVAALKGCLKTNKTLYYFLLPETSVQNTGVEGWRVDIPCNFGVSSTGQFNHNHLLFGNV